MRPPSSVVIGASFFILSFYSLRWTKEIALARLLNTESELRDEAMITIAKIVVQEEKCHSSFKLLLYNSWKKGFKIGHELTPEQQQSVHFPLPHRWHSSPCGPDSRHQSVFTYSVQPPQRNNTKYCPGTHRKAHNTEPCHHVSHNPSSSQWPNTLLQAMELHPWRHHACVLEGGVLDIPVSHLVLMHLHKSAFFDLETMLRSKHVTLVLGSCCPLCSHMPVREVSPSPGRLKQL